MPRWIDQVERYLPFDGEFRRMEDLIVGTFTGRNFGWLPGAKSGSHRATSHESCASDDGTGVDRPDNLMDFPIALSSPEPTQTIPDELRLPPEFRVNIQSASDQEVFNAVVKVVAAYVNGLRFSQTEDCRKSYPLAVRRVLGNRNGLPQQPEQWRNSSRLQPPSLTTREARNWPNLSS